MAARSPLRTPDAAGIAEAAAALAAGGLVAFPTETVYGLGADATDDAAVRRIFAAKGRPPDNPLIVHVSDVDAFASVVTYVTPLARRLAATFLPGPLTLVLDARPEVPSTTTGGLTTVAVRVPDHPVAAALLEAARCPVAAPSANRSGRPSPTTAAHVVADLGAQVEVVLDGGACTVGLESTVVDARGEHPVVLRDGAITREMLGVATVDEASPVHRAASPGTRYRHYAPDCRVEISAPGEATARAATLRDGGESVALIASVAAPEGIVEVARFHGALELAERLYAGLRAAEAAGVDVVVIESVASEGVGRAVMDRVHRAAEAAAHA